MTRRYLCIAIPSLAQTAQLEAGIGRGISSGLILKFRSTRLAVLTSGDETITGLSEDAGVVLGDVFRRHVPTEAFDGHEGAQDEITRIFHDGEASAQLWGDFVAVWFQREELYLCHSPCGALNLFHTNWGDVLLVASDAEILLSVAQRPRSPNWAIIAHHLAYDDLCTGETCLEGVREIRCGEVGVWRDGQMSVKPTWNPWVFADSNAAIWSRNDALELVKREIFRCIGSRRNLSEKYVLDLSGGLDSSILAAVGSSTGVTNTAINLFNPESEGDERFYARSVANHLEMDLIEAMPPTDAIDPLHCARPHLPRPYGRAFLQAFECTSMALMKEVNGTAYLNGGGGDAVFCHLQSSAPVVDALKTFGHAPNAFRVAYDVARAAQCNVWDVGMKAGLKFVRGKDWDTRAPNFEFLTNDFPSVAGALKTTGAAPARAPLPGKVEQIHGIFNCLYSLNSFARSDEMKGVFPLLSQPLVEACLRIPSWIWLGEGRNRLIARYAVEPMLPHAVVWRKSKGGLGQLQRDTIRAKRSLVLEMLTKGSLAQNGLIDCRSIQDELRTDQSHRVAKVMRIMRLCDFEAWCAAT